MTQQGRHTGIQQVELGGGRTVSVSCAESPGAVLQGEFRSPHTARSRSICTLDRGANIYGSLAEDFYLTREDDGRCVLWLGDTGSQDDMDQAHIVPVAWADVDDVSDGEGGRYSTRTIEALLLFAWIRNAGEWYDSETEGSGGDNNSDSGLSDQQVLVVLSAARGRDPFPLPLE